jgi:O-Antigen ligase
VSLEAGQADDIEARVRAALRAARHERIRFFGLLACLAAFTICTLDGGDVAPFCISAVVLLLSAFVPFRLSFPVSILLAVTAYGTVQTLFFPHKIVYYGWTGVLFWLTAAAICAIATHTVRDPDAARRFRFGFVLFGSAVCILELLEQASRTNEYFWFIPSQFATGVYGTFAYWNNFAQFVEILLPVTLWVALGRGKPDVRFVLLAAIQIGAVATSGSRAGSALVIFELITVLALLYLRNRSRTLLYAAAATVLLSVLFVYAAGFSQIMQKLHEKDQLSVRREINRSTLAMIKEHPLTGWGLNTYVSVYPQFARYDAGTYVNRAHNDWLQWAAEGGVLFAGAMLSIFVWSLPRALRTVWGIGLIAVCLHAAVDYPFARFGVCGWYFALLGMLAYV